MSNPVISDFHINALTKEGPKQILKGVDLTVNSGEVHVIMGPSGSGKSTLAYAIAEHLKYETTSGLATLNEVELTDLTVDECARQGLFLTMQYLVKVPGVPVASFLRIAKTALDGKAPKIRTWVKDVENVLNRMNLDSSFSARSVNEGFSSDERKRHEIAQLELPNPRAAIPDETDSGLDIDALCIVSEGVNRYSVQGDQVVMLIIHYIRVLRYIDPTFVHVFVDDRVIDQRGRELVDKPKAEGYEAYIKATVANARAALGPGNDSRRRRGPR